jgi:hypothetical protein
MCLLKRTSYVWGEIFDTGDELKFITGEIMDNKFSIYPFSL